MKDKEILATIYRWMNQSLGRDESDEQSKRRLKDCKDFIEREWQNQDHPLTKSDEGQNYNLSLIGLENMAETKYSKDWYRNKNKKWQNNKEGTKTYKMPDGYSVDQGGALDERHRGLEISEDGTVEEIK